MTYKLRDWGKNELAGAGNGQRCPNCFRDSSTEVACACGFTFANLPPAEGLLPDGTILDNGRYDIGRVLGGPGGFGVVYAGFDRCLRRSVAIKEFFPAQNNLARRDTGSNRVEPSSCCREPFDNWQDKFLQEAQLLAGLNHQRIIRVYDFLEENATSYLIMERLHGCTLAEHIKMTSSNDSYVVVSRLAAKNAKQLLRAALEALEFVHGAGILHLDITPHNLFLRDADPSKLLLIDFGIARSVTSAEKFPVEAGNQYFMAPELKREIKASPSFASDYYGLGMCLYTALGNPPLAAGWQQQLAVNNEDPELVTVITQCLQQQPKKRPQQVAAIMALLSSDTLPPAQPIPIASVQAPKISRLQNLYSWLSSTWKNFLQFASKTLAYKLIMPALPSLPTLPTLPALSVRPRTLLLGLMLVLTGIFLSNFEQYFTLCLQLGICKVSPSLTVQRVAVDDQVTTAPGKSVIIRVLENDIPGQRLTRVTNSQHGRVELHPDGSLTYSPNKGFNGSDQFMYYTTIGVPAKQYQATVTVDVSNKPSDNLGHPQ